MTNKETEIIEAIEELREKQDGMASLLTAISDGVAELLSVHAPAAKAEQPEPVEPDRPDDRLD